MDKPLPDPLIRATPVPENGLPFSCPSSRTPVWNLHPRVFLPFEHLGQELSCPYCGERYLLVPVPE